MQYRKENNSQTTKQKEVLVILMSHIKSTLVFFRIMYMEFWYLFLKAHLFIKYKNNWAVLVYT